VFHAEQYVVNEVTITAGYNLDPLDRFFDVVTMSYNFVKRSSCGSVVKCPTSLGSVPAGTRMSHWW